ncbi:MAG: glycerol-3-phosphate acyltransferase [Acidimicrobiia bacterium]
MDGPLTWLLSATACYLLGAVPFAFLIGSLFGVDLRKVGTGNVGAGNLTRSVGLPAGALAALFDGLKALVPVLVLRNQGFGPAVVSVCGLAVVAGHNWSIFMRGRSGRGLAPSAGVLAGVAPALMVWPGGWAVAGWKFGGGLAGFIGWSSLPVLAAITRRPAPVVLAALGLGLLMVIRRMQGNPGHQPGIRAALYRAVFDRDPGDELAGAEESVSR